MGVSIRQVMVGLLMLATGLPAQAASSRFQDLQVEVIGQGRQVLMIPGLNSGMDSWRDTCLALQDIPLQCHLVQLPGFAGSAPLAGPVEAFVGPVGQQLQAYIREKMAPQPVIAGHSLGGNLGLRLALDQPDLQRVHRAHLLDRMNARHGRVALLAPFSPQDDEAANDEGAGHHDGREQV